MRPKPRLESLIQHRCHRCIKEKEHFSKMHHIDGHRALNGSRQDVVNTVKCATAVMDPKILELCPKAGRKSAHYAPRHNLHTLFSLNPDLNLPLEHMQTAQDNRNGSPAQPHLNPPFPTLASSLLYKDLFQAIPLPCCTTHRKQRRIRRTRASDTLVLQIPTILIQLLRPQSSLPLRDHLQLRLRRCRIECRYLQAREKCMSIIKCCWPKSRGFGSRVVIGRTLVRVDMEIRVSIGMVRKIEERDRRRGHQSRKRPPRRPLQL